MTRVLIDGRPLYDGHSRDRGIGVFLRSLLDRLAPMSDLSLAALVMPGTELPAGVRPVAIRRLDQHRMERFEHALRLSLEIPRAKPDVFHSPALEPPFRTGKPWVQTLHDVTPLVYDDPFFANEAARWKRLFGRMRRASAVVADSRYSAEMAVKIAGIDPAKVHVVLIGVDPAFSALERTAADPPYVLYVGVYGPHKGYAEAIRVADLLAERGFPHRLKVVGTLNPWREEQIRPLLARAAHPERVELLGFVDRDELRRLYAGATALIMTSRVEGFGLPVVEAMAAGTPVVSFRNTALTEVVSGGGELVDDGDAEAMAVAVAALIEDAAKWRESSERGRGHARAFDWNTTAAAYAEIYRTVARGG